MSCQLYSSFAAPQMLAAGAASSNIEHFCRLHQTFPGGSQTILASQFFSIEFCIIQCKLTDSTTATILTKAHFSHRLSSKDYQLAFAKCMCSRTKHGKRCSDYFIRALNCIKINEGTVVCSGLFFSTINETWGFKVNLSILPAIGTNCWSEWHSFDH
jgi:hypothetical protein